MAGQANANAGVPRGKVFHGARGYLVIGGKTVGYVSNVNGTENLEHQPLDVLDNLETEEFVPVAYTVNFTCGLVKVVGRSLKAAGIQIPLSQVLSFGGLTVEIKDRPEDKAVYTIEEAKATSKNFGAAKRQLTVENLQFVAKRMRDEAGLV
jgi:hypothetical protein